MAIDDEAAAAAIDPRVDESSATMEFCSGPTRADLIAASDRIRALSAKVAELPGYAEGIEAAALVAESNLAWDFGGNVAAVIRTLSPLPEPAAVEKMAPTHRHYKGGFYEKLFNAVHSETEEQLVVYRSADGRIWCRPWSMFHGTVRVDGKDVPRFAALHGEG